MLSKVKEQSSERVESSTLFSLQELRRLEDDRVAKEAAAALRVGFRVLRRKSRIVCA